MNKVSYSDQKIGTSTVLQGAVFVVTGMLIGINPSFATDLSIAWSSENLPEVYKYKSQPYLDLAQDYKGLGYVESIGSTALSNQGFNFDLARMEYMLDCEFDTMPNDIEEVEDILRWLRS